LTGSLNLQLLNVFGYGERAGVSWQGPGNSTQVLHLNGSFPYPFRLPVEPDFEFSLHKQDTSWLQLKFTPSLFFETSRTGRLGVFWHHSENSVLSTKLYHSTASHLTVADFSLNNYGLEFRQHTPGFRRNLLIEGYSLMFNGSAGMRKIRQNHHIPENLYENIDLKASVIMLRSQVEKRWKTSARSTVSTMNNFAWISGKEHPQNQLHRLGGFRILKGFDELSIPASAFFITHTEFRYFTGASSYFHTFVSAGWYEQKSPGIYYNALPIGFGTGISLQTQAGILSIDIALGRKKDIPLEFKNTKVHIGYTSLF
jgi:hypothetical protein